MFDRKNRFFNMDEVFIQCVKYQGILTALKVLYHYIICKFFPKLVFSKVYSFMGLKIIFDNSSSIAFMLMELFGLNLYYFKSKIKNPVIIDLGANIGDSVLYFKWLYPKP